MNAPSAFLLSGVLLAGGLAVVCAEPPIIIRQQQRIVGGGFRGGMAIFQSGENAESSGEDGVPEDKPGSPGRLHWQNGESLPGEPAGASTGSLTYKSPQFEEPLVLDWSVLRRYEHNVPPVAPADPFSIALRDGSRVYGDLVSVTGDMVTIHSARHGDARLRRSEVLSARRVSRDGLPAGGLGGEAGWRLLNNQGGEDDAGPALLTGTPAAAPLVTGPGGVLEQPYWNTGVFRAMELPAKVDLTFRLHSSKRPDFQWLLVASPTEILKVETWDDELVLTTGDEQFVSLGKLPALEHTVARRLCWDRKANRCLVYTLDGKLVTDWQMQEPGPGKEQAWRRARKGLFLRNKGRDLALEGLRVRAWDGQPSGAVNGEVPGLELADGRTIPGETTGGAEDGFRVQSGGTDAAAFPLAQLDAIVFSTDAPSPVRTPAMTLTWDDGTVLYGRMDSLADGRATVKIPADDAPLSARVNGLRRLLLPDTRDKDKPEPALAERDRITVGDVTLHGDLSGADDGQPHWLPIGGQKPVAPARGSNYEVRRAKPAQDTPVAPAMFFTSAGDVLPGELRSLDSERVDFESPYVEAKTLRPGDLDAIQFNGNVPAKIASFDDAGWQQTKGDPSKIERKDGKLKMWPGTAFANPSAMQASEVRFTIDGPASTSMRLRLFSSDSDTARGINLILMRSGQSIYSGLETSEGQTEGQQGTNLSSNGPIPLRLVISEQQVILYAGDKQVEAYPVPLSRRAGGGLVIEPASAWGNQTRTVELSNFSAEFSPGHLGMIPVNAEARTQALTVPRFRKEDPPRQALIAMNGDVLRGELVASTASHFAFRSGLESLRVPRDRVRAAVWLKAPAKDAAAPAPAPAASGKLATRCPMSGQYGRMRLRDYVSFLSQFDQELKIKLTVRDANRRASIRFDQPTMGEALDQLCAAFDVAYRLEGDTVIITASGAMPPNMRQAIYWLKEDAIPAGNGPVRDLLAAKGIAFPDGAKVQWESSSHQLVMTNTAENQRKTAEVLRADFGGSLGAPTHWVVMADGTRLGMAVDRFEKDKIIGHHPIYGHCQVPLAGVVAIRTAPPDPDPTVKMYADWRLVPALEPVLPGANDPAKSLVGQEPKPFKLTLLDGGKFDLAEEKGKVVVLDFWATWCGPCVQSMPGLIAAMAEFPPERVRFVGLDQGEAIGVVQRFLDTRGWKLTVAMDSKQDVGQQFGADAIPHTVVIGPDGKVVREWTGAAPDGGAEVAETVKGLLKAQAAPEAVKKGG